MSQSAAVLTGPKDIRIANRTVWAPDQNHVQVSVKATGLCGSDLHYYAHGRNGDFTIKAPLVLGHESSGVISAVGPGVRHLFVGQRVVIEPGIMCRKCKFCDQGRYNLCPNLRFCSSAKTFPHTDGTLQEKINHPAFVIHPIPDSLPLTLASLAEPLSVLLHAGSRVGLCPQHTSASPSASHPPFANGKAVLVFGVGTIGLLACALAKAFGARKVCAIDIDSKRLEFAREWGWADSTYCLPPRDPTAPGASGVNGKVPPIKAALDEMVQKAKSTVQTFLKLLSEPEGFDIVFECTGAEPCIQMGIFASVLGGKLALVGMGSTNVTLPLSNAALREVDIIGSFRYANTWAQAVKLLDDSWRIVQRRRHLPGSERWGFAEGGLGDIHRLITHRFPLNETHKAFELMAKGRDENGGLVLKVVVEGSP